MPVRRVAASVSGTFWSCGGKARRRRSAFFSRSSGSTFPVRFPSHEEPGDAGWHVDASFNYDDRDFFNWRVNVASKGRALLMLCLFSDIGHDDAPTRVRVGSHVETARLLAPAGEGGMMLRELAANGFDEASRCDEALVTGSAGTVYLCEVTAFGSRPQRGSQAPPREPTALTS